jgi:hypothetical protein
MDATLRGILSHQFGAAIDMLENAIRACPDKLWRDREQQPEFWYLAYHTLFLLDLYLTDATKGFAPPPPFTLSELDPSGVLPDRLYEKDELLAYLGHGRSKALERVAALTANTARDRCLYGWIEMTRIEALLYDMRHVQHHPAQLNLVLRQSMASPPDWVARTAIDF